MVRMAPVSVTLSSSSRVRSSVRLSNDLVVVKRKEREMVSD